MPLRTTHDLFRGGEGETTLAFQPFIEIFVLFSIQPFGFRPIVLFRHGIDVRLEATAGSPNVFFGSLPPIEHSFFAVLHDAAEGAQTDRQE